jgi:hypothetical protein
LKLQRCTKSSRPHITISMYAVHDDTKDKAFMIEMSWIKGGKFESVPKEMVDRAEAEAKRALDDGMDED